MKTQRFLADMAVYAAGLLAVFTLAAVSSIAMAQNNSPDCEDNCDAEFVNSKDMLEGIECEHGNEHDDDCRKCYRWTEGGYEPADYSCCDSVAGNGCILFDAQGQATEYMVPNCDGEVPEGSPPGYPLTPVCHCYDCTAPDVNGCEGRIVLWSANCGIFDTEPAGECPTHLPSDISDVDPNIEVVRYDIPQEFINKPAGCSNIPIGSTHQAAMKYTCGGDRDIVYADCITQNCQDPLDFDGVNTEDPDVCEAAGDDGVLVRDDGVVIICGERRQCGTG